MSPEQFEVVDVWERVSLHKLVLFKCLRSSRTGEYFVQSADDFEAPWDGNALLDSQVRFLELLSEASPRDRAEGGATIQEAVERHKKAFDGFD